MKKEKLDIENLSVEEAKQHLDKNQQKYKKLAKVSKVVGISFGVSVFAMIGSLGLIFNVVDKKKKEGDFINQTNYALHNQKYIQQQTQDLIEQVENQEITVEQFRKQVNAVKDYDITEYMKKYESPETYQQYQDVVRESETSVSVALGTSVSVAFCAMGLAMAGDKKIKQRKECQETIRDLKEKISKEETKDKE